MFQSSFADEQTEPASQRMAEWAEYPPPIEGSDEVTRAKLNLLQLAQHSDREHVPSAINRHSYGYVVGALAVGLIVGKVPMLRRLIIKGATWGAGAYAQKAMRQWKGPKQ